MPRIIPARVISSDSVGELLQQICSLEVRPPRQIDDKIPKELERICLRAVARRATDRYPTASEMADDLWHWLDSSQKATDSKLLRTSGATGYVRVDWLTPDGLPTWGDGRLVIVGTKGTIEMRKYIDIGGENGTDHLFLIDNNSVQRIDCTYVDLPHGRQLVQDVLHRTESAMPQARCFKAMELALTAQAMAERHA